jgi:hypothetical protein
MTDIRLLPLTLAGRIVLESPTASRLFDPSLLVIGNESILLKDLERGGVAGRSGAGVLFLDRDRPRERESVETLAGKIERASEDGPASGLALGEGGLMYSTGT